MTGSRKAGAPSNEKGGLILSDKSARAADENDNIEQHIDRAIELISSIAGSALGLVPGEPISGALIGTASGKGLEIALKKTKQEILARVLSSREKARALNALDVAVEEVQRRLKSGEKLREDDFFDEKPTGRSDAGEVLEHMLLKAQREPEEKKIQYMGYLYGSLPFNPGISVHMAHQLIKAAEQLTYRQLCILKLCAVKDKFGLRNNNYREHYGIEKDLYEVLHECADLHNKEYIHSGLDTLTFERNALSRLRSIVPSDMAFHRIGDYLYNLMKLSLIPDGDIIPIADQLK